MKDFKWQLLIYLIVGVWVHSCSQINQAENETAHPATELIHQAHKDYIAGWLDMDEEKVMGLLEENSMIQPNRITPVAGRENIRNFWFPKDSSVTTINRFDTEIIDLSFQDSLAIMNYSSVLDWDYQKDTLNFGMIQNGIAMAIYRKQSDESWKIWRLMWTDISAIQK